MEQDAGGEDGEAEPRRPDGHDEGGLEGQGSPGEEVEQHALVEEPLRSHEALQVLDAQRQGDGGAVVPGVAPRLRPG